MPAAHRFVAEDARRRVRLTVAGAVARPGGTVELMRKAIRMICWNAQEAARRAAPLGAAGYDVAAGPFDPNDLRAMRLNPPEAVVIDLARLPSHGRDVALALRQQKSTRGIPLVFVDGEAAKVDRIRSLLPDAVYTTWGRMRGAVKGAIAHPPERAAARISALAGYSGTPLPRKLGIKEGAKVALVGAPPDFPATLGALPKGALLREGAAGKPDLILWFTRSRAELLRGIRRMARLVAPGGGPAGVRHGGRDGLWIAWPKKSSTLASDVSEKEVRASGLANGLVDYKICAIDGTWSGLKFARRKQRA